MQKRTPICYFSLLTLQRSKVGNKWVDEYSSHGNTPIHPVLRSRESTVKSRVDWQPPVAQLWMRHPLAAPAAPSHWLSMEGTLERGHSCSTWVSFQGQRWVWLIGCCIVWGSSYSRLSLPSLLSQVSDLHQSLKPLNAHSCSLPLYLSTNVSLRKPVYKSHASISCLEDLTQGVWGKRPSWSTNW